MEITQQIKSGWKVFTTIKVVLKAMLNKTLRANLFNSTVFLAMLYASETWAATTKERTKIGYSTEANGKIHVGNIIK